MGKQTELVKPKPVRNFWIDCYIDGRKTPMSGGPRAKDGGFTLYVKMRDKGGVTTPLVIQGILVGSVLHLVATDNMGKQTFLTHCTER